MSHPLPLPENVDVLRTLRPRFVQSSRDVAVGGGGRYHNLRFTAEVAETLSGGHCPWSRS